MAYDLSFSPEFFLAEGEPYDRSTLALNAKGRPISVYSALCLMAERAPERWREMAIEVFGMRAETLDRGITLDPETVLERIQETNTCGTISNPVDVWVDPEGYYRVNVWDGPESEEP